MLGTLLVPGIGIVPAVLPEGAFPPPVLPVDPPPPVRCATTGMQITRPRIMKRRQWELFMAVLLRRRIPGAPTFLGLCYAVSGDLNAKLATSGDGIAAGNSPSSISQWEMVEPEHRVAEWRLVCAPEAGLKESRPNSILPIPCCREKRRELSAKCGRARMFAGFHENRQGISREFRKFRRKVPVICR